MDLSELFTMKSSKLDPKILNKFLLTHFAFCWVVSEYFSRLFTHFASMEYRVVIFYG
jgi:hypothetical protein